MKKIVGAAAALAMLGGAAMADIGFSYTGSNYFTTSGGNLGYDGNDRTDCLSVSLQNQYGGAVVDFDTDGGSLVQDEYYGWLNFTPPAGQLQVTAGVWNGRYVNRVRADAGDLDGADFELFKPGVINGSTGKDSDNLTQGKVAVVAAYTNQDWLPGTLMIKAGLVKSAWNPDANSDTTKKTTAKESGDVSDAETVVNSGFVAEVAYQQADLIRANFAFRSLVKKNYSFAAFVSPLMIKDTSLTLGATVATVANYAKYEGDAAKAWQDSGVEWGIDLRARYKVNDNLSLTTMNNISSRYLSSKTVWDTTSAFDPVTATFASTKTYAVTDGNNVLALWNMLNATYVIADNLTAGLTLNFVTDNLTNSEGLRNKKDNRIDRNISVTVSPSLVISATEKVTVTTAFRAEWENVDFAHWTENLANVTIPVIFSFSY